MHPDYEFTVHSTAAVPIIAIVDLDKGKTVTNDAEHVLAEIEAEGFDLDRHRVIYRDTDGVWDEMLIGPEHARFAGFAPVRETELQAALEKVAASVEEERAQLRHDFWRQKDEGGPVNDN